MYGMLWVNQRLNYFLEHSVVLPLMSFARVWIFHEEHNPCLFEVLSDINISNSPAKIFNDLPTVFITKLDTKQIVK